MEQEQPTYEEMATALAVYAYSYCAEHNGRVYYNIAKSNGFDVAPDILTRLNVMAGRGANADFAIHWAPGQDLPIWRNPNEPNRYEFAIAFITVVRWDLKSERFRVGGFAPALRTSNYPREPHDNHAPGIHHCGYAARLIANCVQQMGLGEGLEEGFLMLNERGEAVPEHWHYWTHENSVRHLAKREPSRRQRRELKLQGVIDPGRPRYL